MTTGLQIDGICEKIFLSLNEISKNKQIHSICTCTCSKNVSVC